MDCIDVWGVGSRIGHRLKLFNISNALSLANADVKEMKAAFNINVAKTVEELNGIERLFWDDVRNPKQQIFSTRSVSRPIQTLDTLVRVLSSHALNVCRKAREQKSLIAQMVIFARTSPFRQDASVSINSVITFVSPTSCYKKVATAVRLHTEKIFQPGFDFIKVGAGAIALVDEAHSISDLFDDKQDDIATSSVVDRVNQRFGRGAVVLGSVLNTDPATHLVSRNQLSPPYLSSWNHLPIILCK